MKIKIGILIFILVLAGSGFFYWQSQKDVRELNKTLPKGVRVVKSLFGNEYKVVNKIDGYEFKVPKEWRGVEKIEYTAEWTEKGYVGKGIGMTGREETEKSIGVDYYKIEEKNIDLETWVKKFFDSFGLVGELNEDSINRIEVVKTQEIVHMGGDYIYFLGSKNNLIIYAISGNSEKLIREIITNGKW